MLLVVARDFVSLCLISWPLAGRKTSSIYPSVCLFVCLSVYMCGYDLTGKSVSVILDCQCYIVDLVLLSEQYDPRPARATWQQLRKKYSHCHSLNKVRNVPFQVGSGAAHLCQPHRSLGPGCPFPATHIKGVNRLPLERAGCWWAVVL